MKRVQEAIQVSLEPGGAGPATFVRNGRRYTVLRVEAVWKELGNWWDGAGERTLFRVTARREGAPPRASPLGGAARAPRRAAIEAPGVYELCLDEAGGSWTLMKMAD